MLNKIINIGRNSKFLQEVLTKYKSRFNNFKMLKASFKYIKIEDKTVGYYQSLFFVFVQDSVYQKSLILFNIKTLILK